MSDSFFSVEFLFRHQRPRKYQKELMEDIYRALQEGKHVVAHAPTGIGKTDAVLSAALTYIKESGKIVVYLSPKISQHEMALKVVRGINEKYGTGFRAVEFVGKRYMCIHPLAKRLPPEDFYEVCKRLREKEECPYYKAYVEDAAVDYATLLPEVVSHQDVMDVATARAHCPYEAASEVLSVADVVIGDYYHLFSPKTSKVFLKKLARPLSSVILIVDEAHNLPERIRKVLTFSLSTRTLARAEREAAGLDPEAVSTLRSMREELESWGAALSPGEERKIEREDFIEKFPFDFEKFAEHLEDLGKEYLEITGKGKSNLIRVARFLLGWTLSDSTFLHYIKRWKGGETVSVVKKALDPAELSAPIFSEVHSGILISGTLTPPEMYRDLLGLEPDRTMLREYPSPFPPENRLVLVVPTVTTRYSRRQPMEYQRIAREVVRIAEAIPGNVAVFFPSYEVLNGVLPFIQTKKQVFVQREGMRPEEAYELIHRFKSGRNGLLVGVAGGSFAEGVDYPGEELIGVIIVGIPLAEMNMETEALIEYYEEKYGRGWFYGYIYPAIAKALQAAGRCIRSETDRGVLIFLDERYTWKNYKKAFPKDFSPVVTANPLLYIRRFFAEQNKTCVNP